MGAGAWASYVAKSELFLASGMRNWSVNRANASGSRFEALPDSNHVTRVVTEVTGLITVRPGRCGTDRHIKDDITGQLLLISRKPAISPPQGSV